MRTEPLGIGARGLGKRFGADWIVYAFDRELAPGSRTALAGPNGSGKSTLLRLLAGQLLPSVGAVGFYGSAPTGGLPAIAIDPEAVYRHVALAGPYLELIDELTGLELVGLHARLRGFRQNLRPDDLWERLAWARAIRRQAVGSYSSGMKQRLRLLLALATEAGAVFLDEPTSNLDAEGVAWYHHLVDDWLGGRTLVVASNEERDFVADSTRIEAVDWQ